MEQNTEDTSGTAIVPNSTPSFQNRMEEKAKSYSSRLNYNNIYLKFYRVPTLLSWIVGVLFSVVFAEVLYLFLPHNWVGFGAMVGFTVVMWGYIRPIINVACLMMLVRRRVWEWGRTRFDTWASIGIWMMMTEPSTLDTLVADESDWVPDLENGGVLGDTKTLPLIA